MILSLLLAATSSLVVFLSYKVRSLQKEQERLRREGTEYSKVLFLNSRYASMGETIGNIAHQWKQPLNAIGTIQNSIKAALIFQGEISKEKLLYSVETSFKLLQHLAETIDTFYSFLSQQNSEKMSFTVADELEKVRKITEYSFENSHITLNYELEINPTIQGNANEFTHAMLNLILNAKDAFDGASVDAPLITVRVSDGDNICHITVSDNAGGIRLKPVEMVFDLHITTKEEGSGLGLFMTKNIIENRFGGKISVKNVKGGACFRIALPYAEYGEHYADTVTPDEKLTLDRINQLSRKIIELEEIEKVLNKWADIFEQAQWGIVMCGADTMTLDLMNPAFAQMHGFEVNELIKKPIESIFAPECRDHVQCILQTVYQESHYAFESIHIRKDGSLFPVAIDITAVKDDNNNVLYRIANVRDITVYKEAEEKLLLKQFALDTIHEAVYLIDENSMFYYVNDGACKALGYTKEELLSMGVVDIDPNCSVGWWGIHWEDIKKLKTVLGQASHRKKDGSVFPIEVSSNYFEYNGVGYSLAVARDITERLQLEEQKENDRMRLFFERQLVGMAITSPEKGWLKVNRRLEEMLGYSFEELCGMNWVEVTHPDDLAADVEGFERMAAGEIESYTVEKRYVHKDGHFVHAFLSIGCVRDEDGTLDYVLALIEDITERKAAQEALDAKDQELRALADSSPGMMGSFYLRPDGSTCMPYVSPNITDLFGLAPEDVADDNSRIFKLNHPDDNDRIFETIAESARTMSVWHQEYRIIHPTKGERWMESNTMPQPHPDGGIVWYGYIHDITERKAAEEALQSNRNLLHAILESSPGVITFALDKNYRYMAFDSKHTNVMRTIFGKEIAIGMNMLEAVIVDADREIAKRSFDRALGGESFIAEEEYGDERLSRNYWQIFYAPIYSERDEIIGLTCFNMDITERKKAEELIQTLNTTLEKRVIERTSQLEEAVMTLHNEMTQKNMLQQERLLLEERLFKIAASVPGVNYIFEKTVEGIVRFIYLAPGFEELFGLSADAAMGDFTVVMEHVHPDDRDRIWQSIADTEHYITKYHEEFRILHPKKETVWIEGRSSPELHNEGNILWYGFFHDVTIRKDAEAALACSEETFRAMVENSPDVIIRYDLECRRTYINPMGQLLMGKPLEEIIGKTPSEYSPLPVSAEFEKIFTRVVSEGQEIELESSYCTSEGEVRWGSQRIVPELDIEGNVSGVMVIGRDMTERKKVEQHLKLLERALNSSAEAVYINNKDLAIIYVNDEACRMLGYSRAELLSMKILEIDAKYTLQEIDEIIETKIRDGKVIFETQHRKKYGSVIDVEVAGSFFIHEEDTILISIVKEIAPRG